MNEQVQKNVNHFKEQFPDWENMLKSYLTDGSNDIDSAAVEGFWKLINLLCEAIKDEQCSLDEASKLFGADLQKELDRLFHSRLRPFFSCGLVRRNEEEKRIQLEDLIDEIWQQRIVRRNPNYQFEQKSIEGLTASTEELGEFVTTLSAIVDHCVSRLLNYDGMVYTIARQTRISQELSQYIARKIERDYEELRCNYIIKTLTFVRNKPSGG